MALFLLATGSTAGCQRVSVADELSPGPPLPDPGNSGCGGRGQGLSYKLEHVSGNLPSGQAKSADYIKKVKTAQHAFLPRTRGFAVEGVVPEGAITYVDSTRGDSAALWQPERAPAMSLESVH
jgi:hypothetical protein